MQISEQQLQNNNKKSLERTKYAQCNDSNPPSPTGNLGRTSKGWNEISAIYSSPKGNLGRMLVKLADEKLELIIWHLEKKGIAQKGGRNRSSPHDRSERD